MSIKVTYPAPVAIGASFTSSVNMKGEFNHFSVIFPSTNPLTAAADITAQTSIDGGTTWSTVAYSNSPSTATSTLVNWSASRTSWGANVMCEAALFAPSLFRIKFGTAATAAGTLYVVAGKD
jgi:hypothetical protein